MRLSFHFWYITVSLCGMAAEGVIQLEEPKLPGSVVILGEGTIADPDKWTPFPTPPPVVTDAPTPYPTPATAAPTPMNYIMYEKGEARECPSGTYTVDLDDCLDAGELMASNKYSFPFYLDEHENDLTAPCGCYVKQKPRGNMIVEYNTCEEMAVYESVGYGQCDDGGGQPFFPALYGHVASDEFCEAACTVTDGCIAYDYSTAAGDNCYLRFTSLVTRDAASSSFNQKYDGCANNCNKDTLTTGSKPYNFLVCGSTNGLEECGGSTALAAHDELHPVRCCSDTNLRDFEKRQSCDVWGGTKFRGICYGQKTYAEAVDICESVGARLCTAEELADDCTKNTGCYYNKKLVWSSTSSTIGVDGEPIAAVLYTEDNFGGQAVSYYEAQYDYNSFVAQGMANDELSSIRVMPGFTVNIYQDSSFQGWHAVFPAGDYTTEEMEARGAFANDASSMIITKESTCYKKTMSIPEGNPNPKTQLICKLSQGIDATVDGLGEWAKVYGYGTEAGGDDRTLWAPDVLSGEFYIRRECPNCADTHKTIIYKRLTPLPAGFNVEHLFTDTWSSTNNVLNVDFKLYSTMAYALSDITPWTYCNYDDNTVGFPRDCGPFGYVPYQWINLYTGHGQVDWAFYVWTGSEEDSTTLAGECVASSPTECGCSVVNQMDYRGPIANTVGGLTCQAWDSQYPHSHEYTSENFPDSGLEGNACRNPDNWHEGAWCYTTDPEVRWAVCDVPKCFVPPFDHAWYKEYPFMPWHLPPWHIVMNLNPSDGVNSGYGADIWYTEEDVSIDEQALETDYKDFTANWHRDFDCITIARHNARKIDAAKVWKMNTIKTFRDHFNNQTHSARAIVTSDGPEQVYILEDAENIDIDPIMASKGPDNNLAFNWRYGNSGSRIVLTDVGNFNGELSCETCNDYATHGLGNDFDDADIMSGGASYAFWHDASVIQGACGAGACAVQGADSGSIWSPQNKFGNYAIYVATSNDDGSCPEFLINNAEGVSYSGGNQA